MVLRPVRFLWKQFCGPQITAIMTALYRWFQSNFNTQINYLSTISIDTATDSHLTLIGACQGIRRPVVVFSDISNFIFTYEPEHGMDYGVSDLANPTVGGHFTDLEADRRSHEAILCPGIFFRPILQAKRDTEGLGASVVFLDKMLSYCWKALGNPGEPEYIIKFATGEDIPYGRTWGDIQVLLGPITHWGEPDMAIEWQNVLSTVFNALLNPNAYITFDFGSE